MMKNEKGINIISLIVTIIVIIILSAIVINIGTQGLDSTDTAVIASEKKAIETAIVERFADYSFDKETFPLIGTEISSDDIVDFSEADASHLNYMRKINASNMRSLGIKNATGAEYIVDYYSGDVFGPLEEEE